MPANITLPLPTTAIDMPGEPVSAAGQAGIQMAGIGVTLGISILSGLITGNYDGLHLLSTTLVLY